MKKAIMIVTGVALACAVGAGGSIFGWFAGLSVQAVWALAILCGCIVWWVAGIFPEFVTALVMAIAFVLVSGIPTETVFSAFASSTWWLLVAAFALGFGMQKTGLMRRMADAILRVFPRTFNMQAAGLMAAGTLVGPFIPSLSAKATMLAPLSLGISDSLGYERKGRQATGLFLAMFCGLRNVGPVVISASIIGYGLVATLPADVAAQFDMLHWFLAMLPWFIFVMVANYLAIVMLFAPKREERESQGDIMQGDVARKGGVRGGFAQENTAQESTLQKDVPQKSTLQKDASMSVSEKRMAIIIVCCILLWISEPLHAIPSHIVAIAAMVAMLICNVVSAKDLRSGIAWDSLIFIGVVLGLASSFAYLGIDEWIVASCEPIFRSLATSPYLFIAGICFITIVLRFIIVSEMAYINIFMAFMVPLVLTLGINPWVVGVSVYAVVNPWFVLYQNPIYMTAYYATKGKMVRQSTSAAFCALYLVICVCGLLISVPFWQSIGLL